MLIPRFLLCRSLLPALLLAFSNGASIASPHAHLPSHPPGPSLRGRVIADMTAFLKGKSVTAGKFMSHCDSLVLALMAPEVARTHDELYQRDSSLVLDGGFQLSGLVFFVGSDHCQIGFITRGDTVVCAGIVFEEAPIALVVADEPLMRDLTASHRAVYGHTPDLTDSIDSPFLSHMFGFACGPSGAPMRDCRRMLELISDEDYRTLSRWLRSMSPEMRAYGAFGLLVLSEQGEMEARDSVVIARVVNSSTPVWTCAGCMWHRRMSSASLLAPVAAAPGKAFAMLQRNGLVTGTLKDDR
jgi:hypothetical protein